jgi:hypothetical protein
VSIYSFAFLFDYLNFEKKISPALNELMNGNFRELERIAIKLERDNSEIWDLVELSRIPHYDNDLKKGSEDVVGAGVLPWLLLVISSYCSGFSHHLDFGILEEIGIKEKPLESLLINIAPEFVPTDYADGKFTINDSALYWLGLNDIEKIKDILRTNVKQAGSGESNGFMTLLDNAMAANKALILGWWVN